MYLIKIILRKITPPKVKNAIARTHLLHEGKEGERKKEDGKQELVAVFDILAADC